MAFGYALSVLGDFHLAEDASQDAFLAAYFGIAALREPEAFPGWLRGIVRHQSHRILRRRHLEEVPLEHAAALAAQGGEPERHLERKEERAEVLSAIASLPRAQREVVTLFYVQEHTQREIAAFLDLPVSTVNNRLHAARTRLKRRMLAMVGDTFKENALPDDFATRVGKIVQVTGPVIEVQFAPDELPELLSALTITDEPRKIYVTVEVAQRLENGIVRCIAASPIQGLRKGMKVARSPEGARPPVDRAAIERAVDILGGQAKKRGQRSEGAAILETGIKVIDLFCPYGVGGKIGIFGEAGIGKLVLVEELVRRIAAGPTGLSLFTFVHGADVAAFQQGWTKDPLYTGGTRGEVQTFYISSEDATDPERAAAMSFLDSVTFLSRDLAAMRLYPAVDPLASSSRFLDPAIVGQEHWDVAQRARQALRRAKELQSANRDPGNLSAEEQQIVSRARKLQRFFSQYFFIAEPYTGFPGTEVSRENTVQACKAILDGVYDDRPEEAFLYTGGIEEAEEKARKMVPGG